MILHKLTFLSIIFISLIACGGGSSSDSIDTNNKLFAYKSQTSLQDNILIDCLDVRPNDFTSCTLGTLPLIGMEYDNPTVADIMSRVVVTHDWMGERFEQLLNTWPSEMLPLFKGVTGVVIARNIRPSFFTTRSGAIYIDSAYLWLTVEEKRVIDQSDDYRSDFAAELNFLTASYYVNGVGDGLAYNVNYRLDDDVERSLSDITLSTARLIFHELAHANDFYNHTQMDSFSLSDTIREVADPVVSDSLHALYPLTNQTMLDLGQVMFRGLEASASQKALSPVAVGAAFDSEGANDDYAYAKFPDEGEALADTPSFEDTAMLFEAVMMKYLFDKDRLFSVIDRPTSDDPHYSEYVVRYGQYNRIAANKVLPRAQLIAEQIMPLADGEWQDFFDNLALEDEYELVLGLNLRDNIWGNYASTTSFNHKQDARLKFNPLHDHSHQH